MPAGGFRRQQARGPLLVPAYSREKQMARHQRQAKSANAGRIDTNDKIERLRALRLSDEAARQAAGTWGEMTVGEIAHKGSGEVFVYSWKGRQQPDLEKLPAKRPIAKRAAEHACLVDWLLAHKMTGFETTLIGWNLSEAEAARLQAARIAERRAEGGSVKNPGEQPASPETHAAI
jgi:hypothetical protein